MLFHSSVWESQRDAFWTRIFVWSSTYLKQAIIDPQNGQVCGLVSFLPLENNVERRDNILERLNADVGCRQDNVQSFFSQQLDSRCFRGASNVISWWTDSRQVVLLTVNLVAVRSSVNTQVRRHQWTTPANDLCFVPSVTKKQKLGGKDR